MIVNPGQPAAELIESWFCDRCKRENYGAPLIYAVHLCLRCIALVAEDPRLAYHYRAKVYLLQREVCTLRDINNALRERLARAEGHISC